MPSAEDSAKIVAAAKADPDARPLTKKQLQAMVPLRSVRGRPPLENKKMLVSVRYSPEVLAYFRSTGEGWQSRMDGVLRDYVSKQTARRAAGRSNPHLHGTVRKRRKNPAPRTPGP
jgi:uncharacterized protein (DUF4415 family)